MSGLIGFIGAFLVGWGAMTYFMADAASRSVTALIPAVVGALLLICTFIAAKATLRKHAMHGAMLIALLGALAPLGRIIPVAMKGELTWGLPLVSQIVLMAGCVIVLIAGIRSFKAARRGTSNNA